MEDDEPAPALPEAQEAQVSIPNIPIPRTSDGDVKYTILSFDKVFTAVLALGHSRT